MVLTAIPFKRYALSRTLRPRTRTIHLDMTGSPTNSVQEDMSSSRNIREDDPVVAWLPFSSGCLNREFLATRISIGRPSWTVQFGEGSVWDRIKSANLSSDPL